MRKDTAVAALADNNLAGILYVLFGVIAFTTQDVIVKFLSGDYSIHEIVLLRSLGAAPVVVALLIYEGGFRSLLKAPVGLLSLRGLIHYFSYTLWYLTIATMTIADALAIGFVAPLMITGLSSLLLGAKVGLNRWLAIIAGFAGTVIMLRPGFGVFEPAALLVLASSACYSAAVILTRKLAPVATSPAMSLVAILVAGLASIGWGLVAGEGQFATGVHPSLAFMLRAWIWPPTFDLMLMIATGIAASAGMICLTQAYRLGQPAVVAPFEYAGMVWALIAGYVMWRQVPDGISMIGITIIIGAGLYIASLELRERRAAGS